MPKLFWGFIHVQETTKFHKTESAHKAENTDEIDSIQSTDCIEVDEAENNEEDDIDPDDLEKELRVKTKFISQVHRDYEHNNFFHKKRKLYLINCQLKIPYLTIV